ncbi:hypothetical protein, partial [Brachybacterium alimentarium]|uniref:hypothetical protein n=1 Tax=Brachybacterium alimentarium TaxID=47845 RepID=UPI003FD39257
LVRPEESVSAYPKKPTSKGAHTRRDGSFVMREFDALRGGGVNQESVVLVTIGVADNGEHGIACRWKE